MKWRLVVLPAVLVLSLLVGACSGLTAHTAAEVPSNFSLVVSPSPLVATVNPGQATQLKLKVLNNGNGTENLQIAARSFRFNSSNGQVSLGDSPLPEVNSWISYSAPKFTVTQGQWFNEGIDIKVPKDAGFSYSFAFVVTRQSNPQPTQSGRLIKGAVAVFCLLNVNRPGATRQLSVVSFSVSRHMYEWLPATFSIRVKNTGNTIVQPFGNIFVQRGSNDKKPLAALSINPASGYILPGTERTFSASWSDGFPSSHTTTAPDGNTHTSLVLNWNRLSTLRIGRYTGKLVAVYNDGQRDVPVTGQLTFWVIPWVAIIGLIVLIAALWFLQHWRLKRKTEKAVKKALAAAKKAEANHA